MKHSPGFEKLVQDIRSNVSEISTDAVNSKIKNGANFHLIDVREESEYAAGSIPVALHIGKGVLERDIEAKIPDPNAEIILYCGGGYRSVLAAASLIKMGYKNVWSMSGGWREWNEKKFPTHKPS